MKIEIKRFHSPDIQSLEEHRPEKNDSFCFLLQIIAGPLGEAGEESFDLLVCTPKWLSEKHDRKEILIGEHMLIVFQFDWENIKKKLIEKVEELEGEDWESLALKLDRIGKWEFRDYLPGPA